MTGLEPHPIFTLPTQEQALAMGPERFQAVIAERKRRMELEQSDPFKYGYEAPIWHVVDDLLVDGHDVKLLVPDAAGVLVPGPIIKGAPEILISGSNRSSKSEYCGKKCMKILDSTRNGRGWSFADTGPISIARQQPLFWRYMPGNIRLMARDTGKAKQGAILNVSYTLKGGFTEQSFVLPNGAQHWFKNYAQDVENMEGDKLHIAWFDELRDPELLRTVRFRMGDFGGLILVSFTAIDEAYTNIVDEYDANSRLALEVPAELLPVRDAQGRPTGHYENVPRVKVAGPGTEGTTRANIVYFHITDNPFYGFEPHAAKPLPGAPPKPSGKERFYAILRKATRSTILARAYGVLLRGRATQCPRFSEAIHVFEPERIPRGGTNYHIVDPCPGRNWFMLWVKVIAWGDLRKRYVYREWPSYGHDEAYIPGYGVLGPWALPDKAADGKRGPAQAPLGLGLHRYKEEILRLEGSLPPNLRAELERERARAAAPIATDPWERAAAAQRPPAAPRTNRPAAIAEEIAERRMDSRGGAAPRETEEKNTTLFEQMADIGMEFRPSSGKEIVEGVTLINEALDYDDDVPIGTYSPTLGRINEPLLYVSRRCPNLIHALKTWTGKDGQHGATKDPIDTLRYIVLDNLDDIGQGAFEWQGVTPR